MSLAHTAIPFFVEVSDGTRVLEMDEVLQGCGSLGSAPKAQG